MTTNKPRLIPEPFFISGPTGRLFALQLRPAAYAKPSRAVLFFPPFAEEMNKSRRMVSLQACRFAAAGWRVLLVDLFGTGDSDGEFSQASVSLWREDMLTAAQWLLADGVDRLVLWGLRLGTALVTSTEPDVRTATMGALFWQPVIKGEGYLTQFLRLRLAGEMVAGTDSVTTKDLRQSLQSGQSVEVAGYEVSPGLAAELDLIAVKEAMAGLPSPIGCVQISRSGRLSAPIMQITESRMSRLLETHTVTVEGDPFWQTAEICIVENLLEESSKWLATLT